MKRILLLTLTLVTLAALTASAGMVVNTCTSTYIAFNFSSTQVSSGWDTAAVSTDTPPNIVVTKYVKNLRSGIEDNYMVPALQADTIEFRIVWENTGSAAADTMTLYDYIPSGRTYVSSSISDTEINCDTTTYGTATYNDGMIEYKVHAAAGTDPGPRSNGEIKFRVTVD